MTHAINSSTKLLDRHYKNVHTQMIKSWRGETDKKKKKKGGDKRKGKKRKLKRERKKEEENK